MNNQNRNIIVFVLSDQNMVSLLGPLEVISQKVNLPLDLIKSVFLMLLSIPLCAVLRLIETPKLRSTFSLVVGIAYLVIQLQIWTFYVLSVALIPFILFKVVKGHYLLIAYVVSGLFLLFIHVYRFMNDYMSWKIDCSVPVMYLTTKVIYFTNYIAQKGNKQSLFDYLTYCFFFPAALIGPTYNYEMFQHFINRQFGYESPMIKSNSFLKQFVKALVFTVATVILMPKFNQHWVLQNSWYLSLSPLSKFLIINIIGISYRVKFYTAWTFTQIALDTCGLSWNENKQDYSSVRCGSARFQTQINPRNKTNYWNTSVQIWLKEMIFDKVLSKTKSSNLATFVTFFVSAFWHGIYIIYYIAFVQWACVITISKWAYKMALSYPKIAENTFAKILAYFVGCCMLSYIGMLIVVLTFKEGMQFYKDLHYIGHYLIGGLLLLSFIIKPKRHRGQKHDKSSQKLTTDPQKAQKQRIE